MIFRISLVYVLMLSMVSSLCFDDV